MESTLEKIVRDYITDIIHLSLATSNNNIPWISEVHFSYDTDLKLYFISRPNRRHSMDITHNQRVAGNIVKQHQPGDKVRGVYFEGKAEMLSNVLVDDNAFQTYLARFGGDETVLTEQYEENGHHFYKISIEKFYVFDEMELEPAGKHELNWK